MATSIVGTITKDRLGWTDPKYVRVGNTYVGDWIRGRLNEIPEGVVVSVSVEVIDNGEPPNDTS